MYRWDRITLKEKAKMAMRKNYWTCVLAALLLELLSGGISLQININLDNIRAIRLTPLFLGILSGIVCAGLLLRIFVFSPLEVGGCRFFVENAKRNPRMSRILTPFNGGYYGKIVLTLLLRDVYIFLWSLLFVIPGIIKAYEYCMVPYLLAEHPEMSRQEIFAVSRQMMMGEKFNTFVLELSFLGWALVGVVTMGLADIFYTWPYQHATMAELYLALRREPEPSYYDSYDSHSQDTWGGRYD